MRFLSLRPSMPTKPNLMDYAQKKSRAERLQTTDLSSRSSDSGDFACAIAGSVHRCAGAESSPRCSQALSLVCTRSQTYKPPRSPADTTCRRRTSDVAIPSPGPENRRQNGGGTRPLPDLRTRPGSLLMPAWSSRRQAQSTTSETLAAAWLYPWI